MFNEGKDELLANGLPATCTFELSTRQIGLGGTPLAAATTHAGGYGIATGTGYASQTQAEPTPSASRALGRCPEAGRCWTSAQDRARQAWPWPGRRVASPRSIRRRRRS